jgi:hypothetical protein
VRSYCWERAAEAIVAGVAMGYAVGGIDVTRPASPGGGGSGSRKRKCLCGRCAAARGEKRVPMVPIREEAVATKPKKWWQRGGGNRVVATDGDEGAERNELRRRGRHLRRQQRRQASFADEERAEEQPAHALVAIDSLDAEESAAAAAAAARLGESGTAGAVTEADDKKDDKGGKKEEMTPFDIFNMYAGEDQELDYEEFSEMLNKFEIKMVEDKRRELFVSVDKSGDGVMGYSEFEEAWTIIQKLLVTATLERMGFTKKNIAIAMAFIGIFLLFMFAFIFAGVSAFFGGGLVGATVTSGMCAAGGGGGGNEKEEEPDPDAAGDAIASEEG